MRHQAKDAEGRVLYGFRYRFIPQSVSSYKEGQVEVDNGLGKVWLRSTNIPNQHIAFEGKYQPNKRNSSEYALIFNGTDFVLEKLAGGIKDLTNECVQTRKRPFHSWEPSIHPAPIPRNDRKLDGVAATPQNQYQHKRQRSGEASSARAATTSSAITTTVRPSSGCVKSGKATNDADSDAATANAIENTTARSSTPAAQSNVLSTEITNSNDIEQRGGVGGMKTTEEDSSSISSSSSSSSSSSDEEG